MVLRPRAYRAVAGVGVRNEHNLRDGFRFSSTLSQLWLLLSRVRFLSVDDLQHFLFGNVGWHTTLRSSSNTFWRSVRVRFLTWVEAMTSVRFLVSVTLIPLGSMTWVESTTSSSIQWREWKLRRHRSLPKDFFLVRWFRGGDLEARPLKVVMRRERTTSQLFRS